MSVPWINRAWPCSTGDLPRRSIAADEPALERGYAYHQLLKTSQFSRVGARYLLAEAPFSALAAARYRESDGAASA